jgi:hypothetical protein
MIVIGSYAVPRVKVDVRIIKAIPYPEYGWEERRLSEWYVTAKGAVDLIVARFLSEQLKAGQPVQVTFIHEGKLRSGQAYCREVSWPTVIDVTRHTIEEACAISGDVTMEFQGTGVLL